MPKFYNHDTIEILTYNEYQTHELYVEIPKEDSNIIKYYTDLDMEIGKFIRSIPFSSSPVLFSVKFDYYKLKETQVEDVDYFAEVVKNLVISWLVNKSERMNREQRLGIPKALKSARISDVAIVTMVNHKIIQPIINIQLIDENNEVIERVF